MNLYTYVGGNPVNAVDPTGLLSIDDSFSSEQKIQILAILPELLVAIQSPCIKSENLRNCLIDKLTNLNIKYNKSLSDCGQANWTGFSDTIELGNVAFQGKCGPLKSTILHEMIHSCGYITEKVPRACEDSCFGYDPLNQANPCDCK